MDSFPRCTATRGADFGSDGFFGCLSVHRSLHTAQREHLRIRCTGIAGSARLEFWSGEAVRGLTGPGLLPVWARHVVRMEILGNLTIAFLCPLLATGLSCGALVRSCGAAYIKSVVDQT